MPRILAFVNHVRFCLTQAAARRNRRRKGDLRMLKPIGTQFAAVLEKAEIAIAEEYAAAKAALKKLDAEVYEKRNATEQLVFDVQWKQATQRLAEAKSNYDECVKQMAAR